MSLALKHLQALEKKDYLQEQTESILARIEADKSGACWHQGEAANYYRASAVYLDSLPRQKKERLPFYGLTVGMKDLFCIESMTTTAGSAILKNFKAPYTSTVFKTLQDKGVALAAKLSMDEFAMGSFSNTSYLGRTSLANDSERTAGGSSGGCGAALQGGLVDFTVGSDTGGSVRLPAAFCSQVGYKPSYGAFSRYGMIAYASSLDQAGFLTSSIEDMKYLLDADIAIKDEKDMTSRGMSREWVEKKTLRIGYFPEFFDNESVDEEIKKAYRDVCDKTPYELVPVKISYMEYAAQIYYIIACSEASSNLARYQGVFFGQRLIDEKFSGTYWEQCAQYRSKYLGQEVQKRIMLGSYILSSEKFDAMYNKAVALRELMRKDFERVLEQVDLLMLPTSPTCAPKWDEIKSMTSAQIYLSDFMTVPFSLAGLPAVSMPWYKSSRGLGIGIQLVGKHDYQLICDIM